MKTLHKGGKYIVNKENEKVLERLKKGNEIYIEHNQNIFFDFDYYHYCRYNNLSPYIFVYC